MPSWKGVKKMNKNQLGVIGLAAGLAVAGVTGCATKKYVHNETAPLVEHSDQLDAQTAANNRQIRSVDDRAQAGIGHAQTSADTAYQSGQNADKSAHDAETAATDAVHRADSLDSVVKGLDNYKPLGSVTVTFGFDKAVLTKDDRDQLDSFAAQLGSAKSYILEVTGGRILLGRPSITMSSVSAGQTRWCNIWRQSMRLQRTGFI
jgi:OOP family OmpA-OmpF porin